MIRYFIGVKNVRVDTGCNELTVKTHLSLHVRCNIGSMKQQRLPHSMYEKHKWIFTPLPESHLWVSRSRRLRTIPVRALSFWNLGVKALSMMM